MAASKGEKGLSRESAAGPSEVLNACMGAAAADSSLAVKGIGFRRQGAAEPKVESREVSSA